MLKPIITNQFTYQLPGDPNFERKSRQVEASVYSFVSPIKTSKPKLIHVSKEIQSILGFSDEDIQSREFLEVVTGNALFKNSKPYAMCYGGHQFGNWAGQLGDGRAINLGEINDWTLQLKGAGPTPYSRSADGLAVLRSSIREYLCSEAMHHLGVPTTRAMTLSLTGDEVQRDVMYDGNPALEKGAIVTRVAKSFLRFGNFEIFTARNDFINLNQNGFRKIIKKLPFELTNSQLNVLNEINKDLLSNKRMFRIIQGDVGSGKTIVSLLSILNVIQSGYQAAMMSPTEILAKQHFELSKKIDKYNYQISDVIEKPTIKKAPSNQAVIGRYILPKKIFTEIENLKPTKGKEIHITDAIRSLIKKQNKFIAHKFLGKYLDCGTLSGYINSGIQIFKEKK